MVPSERVVTLTKFEWWVVCELEDMHWRSGRSYRAELLRVVEESQGDPDVARGYVESLVEQFKMERPDWEVVWSSINRKRGRRRGS